MDRRKFVLQAVGMSAVLPLGCDSQPLAPSLSEASTYRDDGVRYDVRAFGAVGDGAHDETGAFERALAALPSEGGTLVVPAGVYLIDPLRSVALRDGVTLAMHEKAILKATPVALSSSAVVRATGAQGIRIAGGSIIGERAGHLGADGEWGMGIWIAGCTDVVIEDVYTGDCWGDGIYIGPVCPDCRVESRNVVIRRCRSVNNRRQGLSITGCIGARIEDSEFSGTNGTLPESGIDIEPDGRDVVREVHIVRCRAVRNAGHGMMLVGHNVQDVFFDGNVLSQNAESGLFVHNSGWFSLVDNTVELNGQHGICLDREGRHAVIRENVIGSNSCAAPGRYDNLSVDGGSSENVIANNDFTIVVPSLRNVARFDIHIGSSQCVRNRLHGNFVRDPQGGGGGIVDNGSDTEITPPAIDGADGKSRRRRRRPTRWRSNNRSRRPIRGR